MELKKQIQEELTKITPVKESEKPTDLEKDFYKCLTGLHIPQHWQLKTINQLEGEIRKVGEDCLLWNFEVPLNLAIVSNKNGIGKTHIAFCLYKKFIFSSLEKGKTPYAYFIKTYELLDEIQSSFNNTKNSEEILEKYYKARFLVLDDIFADRGNDFERRVIYKILDKREWNNLPTLVTSNLLLDEIASIDTRISDRLGNSMTKIILNEKIESYRKKT